MGASTTSGPQPVQMPPASWGQCRIYRCRVVGDLADRLCQLHWDRGLDRAEAHHKNVRRWMAMHG